MLKEIEIVMLPTEKATGIWLKEDTNKLSIGSCNVRQPYKPFIPQHLYFLSNEEIKEEDWCFRVNPDNSLANSIPFRANSSVVNTQKHLGYKKIIATTDNSLILPALNIIVFKSPTNLPTCSQSFIGKYIERYNEDNPITKCIVEYEVNNVRIGKGAPIREQDARYSPKLRKNEIIISPVKDSFTRKEVIGIIKDLRKEIHRGKGIRMTVSDKTPIDFVDSTEEWFNSKY